MPEAIIIDWYGPYHSKNELRDAAKDLDEGTRTVYMGVKAYGKVGYIGLTEKPKSRFNNHEKLAHPDHRTFYFGELVTRGVSGRRTAKHSTDHQIAEHALIAKLQPEHNQRLTNKDLNDCVVIYSRFFDKVDWQTPSKAFPKFPKVIAYNSWNEVWDI